ncbi:MAG: hypothetical protein EBT13_07955 [Rhodobacteraceae bacterium]|nr:hypothetical protein [Paracoccaceae bacterium]
MAISTFAELKTAIADTLNRDDLTSAIPNFIVSAEAEMTRIVRHWRMEGRSTAEIDTQYSAVPADFLEPIRFYLTGNGTTPLELISQNDLLDRKTRAQNTSGKPKFYALTAGELEVYPAPDATYDAELYYYKRIAALSDSNTTNWMLTYHPDAYLYGSLIHSAPYLKDDSRLQVWTALFQNAVASINAESEKAKWGGTGLRIKARIA